MSSPERLGLEGLESRPSLEADFLAQQAAHVINLFKRGRVAKIQYGAWYGVVIERQMSEFQLHCTTPLGFLRYLNQCAVDIQRGLLIESGLMTHI